MAKKVETNDAAFGNPVFAFGLDENGKPRGARFTQGLNDRLVGAALDMNCRVIQNHSAALTALGMKLPVGRIYASGKAFIPNIRRELYEKLDAARQQPPEEVEGAIPVNLIKGKESGEPPADPTVSGLPKDWDAITAGHMVLVLDEPGEGYWEAVVLDRQADVLTLRYRDYPKVRKFQRHVSTIGLLNPGPA